MNKLVSIGIVLLLLGCNPVTGKDIQSLQYDMTKEDVLRTIGQYDGYQRKENVEILHYYNRAMSYHHGDKADYYVVLENDKVTEWGAGEIRQYQTKGGAIFFFPIK